MTTVTLISAILSQLRSSHLFYYFTTAHAALKSFNEEKKKRYSLLKLANLLSTLIDFKAKLKTVTSCEILTHFCYIPGYYV